MRVLVLGLAMLAICACGRKPPDGGVEDVGESGLPKNRVGADVVSAAAKAAPVGSNSVPLPTGRSLREISNLLTKRSKEGDARATCQLALELEFCAGTEKQAAYLSAVAERVRASQPGPATSAAKNETLSTISEMAQLRGEYCEGFDSVGADERVKLWRQAANRGHIASMVQYGAGRAFNPNETLAVLDELKAYKQDGVAFMMKAARSGNLQANLLLARAYAPSPSAPERTPFLRQAVEKSSSTSVAYYKVAEELLGQATDAPVTNLQLRAEMASVTHGMSDTELAKAEEVYASLHRELEVVNPAVVSVRGLSDLDPYRAVPGDELCSQDEFLR
ncbi:hypothetical protein GCM10025759_22820 [Lysobacter panacisoli]|uniref:Sel1 repeat family protein n=1 Tax=Lysobacter panacisoli TaxID=1255263 RepID=A0ABP9LF30_9GAMM